MALHSNDARANEADGDSEWLESINEILNQKNSKTESVSRKKFYLSEKNYWIRLKAMTLSREYSELSNLDGYQFQEKCKELLEQLGYNVELGPKTNDAGVDLILLKNKIKTIVECKHQPENPVGRPVVQKLHSAVITNYAHKGMIISSGGFSNQALAYIQKLEKDHKIVIDAWNFDYLLRKIEESLINNNPATLNPDQIFELKRKTESEIKSNAKVFFSMITSSPAKAQNNISITDVKRYDLFTILSIVEIDKKFRDPAGNVVWDCERLDIVPICLNEEIEFNEIEKRVIANCYFRQLLINSRIAPQQTQNLNIQEMIEKVKSLYIQNLSREVNYPGRNNQNHTRMCSFDRNDINLSTIKIIISFWDIHFKVHDKIYSIAVIDSPAEPFCITRASNLPTDSLHTNNKNLVLCNDCAAIVSHLDFPKDKKSFKCRSCSKSLCSDHIWEICTYIPYESHFYCSKCYPRFNLKGKSYMPWLTFVFSAIFLPLASETEDSFIVLYCLMVIIPLVFDLFRLINYIQTRNKLKTYAPSWENSF